MAHHHLMAKHCRKAGTILEMNQTQSEAREPPTSGHKSVMEGPTMMMIVFIGLLYT